ncbi:OmpA family protein [Flavobacteriaceae bacterium TK19130]|nr:OmpA family protein [Thermobacterium salinum]
MKPISIIIVFGMLLFHSCKEATETEIATPETTVSEASEEEDIDLFSEVDEAGWEMSAEAEEGLQAFEKFLESTETFAIEMEYEALLKKHGLQREEIDFVQKKIAHNRNGASEELTAAFKTKMEEAGVSLTLEEAEALIEASEASNRQALTSKYNTLQSRGKINEALQKLGTREQGFLEENLSTYNRNDNKKRLTTLSKLAKSTSETETRAVLMDYYQISEKEVRLLESIPSFFNKIPSEKAAKSANEYQFPKEIKDHLNSGQATEPFQTLVTEALEQKRALANKFIEEASKARKRFYRENPEWDNASNSVDNTYIDERGNFIFLPIGDRSFADVIASQAIGKGGAHPEGALGVPDMSIKRFHEVDPNICNLGLSGSITLKFIDNTLTDVNGPDLYVFEMGAIEPTKLEISKTGNEWIEVGKIEGGTASVDIGPYVSKGDTFQYVRLTDLKTPSGIPGADIDAVAAIGSAMLLSVNSSVLFDSGSYALRDSAVSALSELSETIQQFPKGMVEVQGHTDSDGSAEQNKTLSLKRAQAVAQVLKTQLSDGFTITSKGFGETNPIVENNSPENKQINRRVEILISPKNH